MSSSWERRKEFLIRSLFQDISVPSTIPETDQESTSSDSWSPPVGRKRPPVSTPYNYERHSPLPELIIEREPNRHDETEEFYQKLENKIFREYRKLFLCDDLSSSLESDNSFIELERNIEKDCLNDDTINNVGETTVTENRESKGNEVILGTWPIERSASTTSSGIFFEIVKVTADVHKENNTADSNNTPINDYNSNIQSFREERNDERLSDPHLDDNNDNNSDKESHDKQKTDNDQRETSLNGNSSTEEREIEVMRSHRGTPSVNSLQKHSDSTNKSNNPSLENGEKTFIMESPESNIDKSIDFPSPEHSSTPMKRKMNFTLALSPSKMAKMDVAVQTTGDNWIMKKRLDDWEKLKHNLFMGIPKIYKLVKIDF